MSQYGKSILLKNILHSYTCTGTLSVGTQLYIRICCQSFVDIFTLAGDTAEVICMYAYVCSLGAFKLLLKEHIGDTS